MVGGQLALARVPVHVRRGDPRRERLGGVALAQVVVRSAMLPAEEALALLEGPLEMKPEIIEPWPALRAGDMGRVGQALAGAAACVVGSRQ